jgi:hypothetical protein
MDGSDADVLLRMRDQADNFEKKSDMRDDKLNDGKNYAGMMSNEDYKKKRAEVLEEPDEDLRNREKTRCAIDSARHADRDAAAKEVRDREEREKQRKARLKRDLEEQQQGSSDEPAAAPAGEAPKKKKKKKASYSDASGLSFDAEDDV